MSSIKDLPLEVLEFIVSYINRPKDQQSLCLVSKIFDAIVAPQLYTELSLSLDGRSPEDDKFERVIFPRNSKLKYVQRLRVFEHPESWFKSAPVQIVREKVKERLRAITESLPANVVRYYDSAGSMWANVYFSEYQRFIARQKNLANFRYEGKPWDAMPFHIDDDEELEPQEFGSEELESEILERSMFERLRTMTESYVSLHSRHGVHFSQVLINASEQATSLTLQEPYQFLGLNEHHEINERLSRALSSPTKFIGLRNLSLRRVSLGMIRHEWSPSTMFTSLEHLGIELCSAPGLFLGKLARLYKASSMPPKLKSLSVWHARGRHGSPTPVPVEHLNTFLKSFQGLERLLLRLDAKAVSNRLGEREILQLDSISHHRDSLRFLDIWDTKWWSSCEFKTSVEPLLRKDLAKEFWQQFKALEVLAIPYYLLSSSHPFSSVKFFLPVFHHDMMNILLSVENIRCFAIIAKIRVDIFKTSLKEEELRAMNRKSISEIFKSYRHSVHHKTLRTVSVCNESSFDESSRYHCQTFVRADIASFNERSKDEEPIEVEPSAVKYLVPEFEKMDEWLVQCRYLNPRI